MHFVMPIGLAASALSHTHLADHYRMVMLSGRHICAVSALPHIIMSQSRYSALYELRMAFSLDANETSQQLAHAYLLVAELLRTMNFRRDNRRRETRPCTMVLTLKSDVLIRTYLLNTPLSTCGCMALQAALHLTWAALELQNPARLCPAFHTHFTSSRPPRIIRRWQVNYKAVVRKSRCAIDRQDGARAGAARACACVGLRVLLGKLL